MSTENSPLVQKLWNDWLTYKNSETANELVKNYMYLVHFHAERIGSHLPKSVCKDDLVSFGLLGLFDALNKFEAERNLKFDTYASFRIRGAIMDGLRKEDWLPRTLREQVKLIDQTTHKLEQQLHRKPSAKEIAEELNMTPEEVETAVKNSLFSNVLSIEDKKKGHDSNQEEGIGYSVPDTTFILPDEYIVTDEIKADLVESIKQLNKNEQLVVSLFYREELTLTEIGQVLDLSTSRISQIHKKAIFKLKTILGKINKVII